MPVVDRTIATGFRDQMLNTDFGSTGWVLKDYIIDVYPNLVPGVKTPALWLWGANYSGNIGDNTSVRRLSPVQTITGGATWKQVASGGAGFTAAIKTDGTLWMWGANSYGQLGDNTSTVRSSPVQTITGGTNWSQVSCGYTHTAAIKTDGTLWMWGANSYGRLGDNSTTSRSSPVQTISSGTNWRQVASGGSHTAAIKTDGTLWMWGRNEVGQLGDNTTTSRSSPVQTVAGGTNWSQVVSGGPQSSEGCTVAIKADGTLWSWGNNSRGNLGDNTAIGRSSPVQTIAGGTNWKSAACGRYHNAAIKSDGTLWLWGRGGTNDGVIGDNAQTDRSSPVQTISRGTTWKQVACGVYSTAAIKNDGTLWTWGAYNGDNTINKRSSPVQTIAGGTNWKQVACAGYTTAAIADGNY